MVDLKQKIVVLVPGITGSTLMKPGNPIPMWPTQIAADPIHAATKLNDPDLVAGWPILETVKKNAQEKYVTTPVYGGLITYFELKGFAYHTGPDGVTTLGNHLVGFGYDWRQPNTVTATTLNTWLKTIVSKAKSDAEIWLVGHSMGGLVSRYLLETGMSAAPKVKGLITLGTPHLGAPLALSAITGECNLSDLLNPDIIEVVVDLPNYPSGYELLPPPQITFVRDAAGTGYSIYEAPVNTLLTARPPSGFGAPATSFADARQFFSALSYTKAPAGVPPYYLVYSGGLDTVTGFTYDAKGLTPVTKLRQNNQAGNQAGDSIVPQSSAKFTGGWVPSGNIYATPSPVRHGQLPNDPKVLNKVHAWITTSKSEVDAPSAAEATEPALVG